MNRRTLLAGLAATGLGSRLLSLPAARGRDSEPGLSRVRVTPDGRGFATADGAAFLPFGVNYFRPGTGWAPQLWKRFDAVATRDDFARMRELGVNTVRVFLSYGSFATEPGKLDPEGLEKLDALLEIAAAQGIRVHPTGLDHWEGVPEWARGDRYADERLLAAQEAFWTELAGRYRDNGAILAYDLLNEPAIAWDTPALVARWPAFVQARYGSAAGLRAAWGERAGEATLEAPAVPPPDDAPGSRWLLDYQDFRESVAEEWVGRQAAAIRGADPGALVTVGLIQWSVPALLPGSVRHYAAFRPDRLAPLLDFLEFHFYPMAAGTYTYEGPEAESRNLAYLESVAREVARPGKPVVLAEFGWYGGITPTFQDGLPPASQEDQARWLTRAVESTAGWCRGWLNWGLFDHPEARDPTQGTGLLTADGQLKAAGAAFRDLGTRLTREPQPPPAHAAGPALDWDACRSSARAAADFQSHYHAATRTPPST